jgi:hypothetical protein
VTYVLPSSAAIPVHATLSCGHLPLSVVIAVAVPNLDGRPSPVWADCTGRAERPSPSSSSSTSRKSSWSSQSDRPPASQCVCKLHRLPPNCERELAASALGPGHRGIRCICLRCQLVCCIASADRSSRRDTKRRLTAEQKIDEQGRLCNRDRSISIAGSSRCEDRQLLANRLIVHVSEAEERYLYVFASCQELETAARHWQALARGLSRVQLCVGDEQLLHN